MFIPFFNPHIVLILEPRKIIIPHFIPILEPKNSPLFLISHCTHSGTSKNPHSSFILESDQILISHFILILEPDQIQPIPLQKPYQILSPRVILFSGTLNF
jgi:hypothetical protein